jgi:hypothetical protein
VETRKEAEEIAALKKAKGIHVFIYHKNTLWVTTPKNEELKE